MMTAMTIATQVRDFTSGASSKWWNSCRLLMCYLLGYCRDGRLFMASPSTCSAPHSNGGALLFIAHFARRRSLVVFSYPVIGRDLLQFWPVIGRIQPGFQER